MKILLVGGSGFIGKSFIHSFNNNKLKKFNINKIYIISRNTEILKSNLEFSRKDFQVHLEKKKIQTRPIFTGNTLRHPAFKSLVSNKNKLNEFRNSDYIMKYGLLIGCHQGLSLKDISYIHSAILSYKKIK
jgi:dTDP-4-amino-4,6-dideoxygalactose transaminase